jgi:hypothetical protein
MELILFPLLGTRSRRAIYKTHRRNQAYQKTYYYPRWDLVKRLSKETGLSPDRVIAQMLKERDFLLGRTHKEN